MILLWGLASDRPLAAVYAALRHLDCTTLLLDQRDVLSTEVELSVSANVSGTLCVKNQRIDLSTVSAVYLRPHDSRRLPYIARLDPSDQVWQHALNIEDILLTWIELTSALVVNQPASMAGNNSKPFQAQWIQSLGFAIPETLITTDPHTALAFWRQHERVIYKSVSGLRSIVSCLTPEHESRLADVVWCPTQFQEYIPGDDYRVHVVGEEIFACKIISNADDYRYAVRQGTTSVIEPFHLPEDVAMRCRALAGSMQLLVAGIDLRCTPDGSWYCFEVNPSPGFTYFQDQTKQPIDEAIAKLLASAK